MRHSLQPALRAALACTMLSTAAGAATLGYLPFDGTGHSSVPIQVPNALLVTVTLTKMPGGAKTAPYTAGVFSQLTDQTFTIPAGKSACKFYLGSSGTWPMTFLNRNNPAIVQVMVSSGGGKDDLTPLCLINY